MGHGSCPIQAERMPMASTDNTLPSQVRSFVRLMAAREKDFFNDVALDRDRVHLRLCLADVHAAIMVDLAELDGLGCRRVGIV